MNRTERRRIQRQLKIQQNEIKEVIKGVTVQFETADNVSKFVDHLTDVMRSNRISKKRIQKILDETAESISKKGL